MVPVLRPAVNKHLREGCKGVFPTGVDKVLERVGATTLQDLLFCAKQHGIIGMTGMVSNKCSFDNFNPMDEIPAAACLTTDSAGAEDFMLTPLEKPAAQIAAGTLHVQIGRTFALDEIVETHRCMEDNKAGGEIVVLT